MINSELFGFYRLSMTQRRQRIAQMSHVSAQDFRIIAGEEGLCAEQADQMVENALGVMGLPLGLCVNLLVDGQDRLAPMVTEEASVVAAASHAAKLLRAGGGVRIHVAPPIMIGQVQLLEVPDFHAAQESILGARARLIAEANSCDPCLVEAGGGMVGLEVRRLDPLESDDPLGPMLVVHLHIDVQEAMGANAVNSICERLAPTLAELSKGRARLRILSNLADRRTVTVEGQVPLSALEGKGAAGPEDLAQGIMEASIFAERDPYRAATHNKGIMNGVDAVLLAFGQDWRAVEAGAHSFAARGGRYTALSKWRLQGGALHGRLELPLPVGVVGGVVGNHPAVATLRRLAQVSTSAELASLVAAVGLAQNLGALRALAAEGIQQGHMRVHARNVAAMAGAVNGEIPQVAQVIASRGKVRVSEACRVLSEVRRNPAGALTVADLRRRIEELRTTFLPRVMGLIDEVLQEEQDQSGGASSLVQMCTYHLESGGKRLRALLPLLVAETLGEDPERVLPFAAACEMLHNATLVHDDLQDGDRQRRGQDAVWTRFGMPQAINLGDAMFYYTLALVDRLEVPPARRLGIMRKLVSETLRVIEGQNQEFALKQQASVSLDAYFAMVDGKTSGLFALPMAGAATLCGATASQVKGLQQAAGQMGVLFQIQDDLLDLYGDKGRAAGGSDIREGKRSVLAIHAMEHATAEKALWLRQVLDRDREATTDQEVAEATSLFNETGSLDFALKELIRRRELALNQPDLKGHQPLCQLVNTMCQLFQDPIAALINRHPQRTSCARAI